MPPLSTHAARESSVPANRVVDSAAKSDLQSELASMPAPGLAARLGEDVTQLSSRDVRYMQRTMGNLTVARLVQTGRSQNKDVQREGISPSRQQTHWVGSAGDPLEQQADRVARQVAEGPGVSPGALGSQNAPRVQRRTDETGTAPIGPEGGQVDAQTAGQIRRMQGGGKPIDKVLRSPLEQKLNTDLGHARLHVGGKADELNQKVGARAFTAGSDIFVQRHEYNPNSRAGRNLLYHELTHVHQQTGGDQAVIGRKSNWVQRQDDDAESTAEPQEDFSNIGISGKSHRFTSIFDTYYSDKSFSKNAQTAHDQSMDYLRGLKSKPKDKQARTEQKAEKKAMKSLLHIPRKAGKGMAEQERLLFRGFLVAARAQGTSVDELSAVKAFFLANPDYFKSVAYKDILSQKQGKIKEHILSAEQLNASSVVLNFLFKSMPRDMRALDSDVDTMRDQLGRVVDAALQAGKTETDNSMLRLPAKARQLEKAVGSLVSFRDQGQYYLASKLLGDTKLLFGVVRRMAHYAQIRSKSNLSSENEMGKAKRLGGGQVSKVYEVNYDPNKQTSIQHGVFKQESFSYSPGDSPAAFESGIDVNAPEFGARSVATSEVDKLLGLGMTPQTQFGTHDGEGGTVQDWAKGNSPQQLDSEGSVKYREFDYSDPEVQRQLATLQLFDAITGQVDRHPGNYYIYQGPEGTQVTAIDNDLSFGVNKGVEKLWDTNWNRPLANDQSKGVPLFVDESIAEQILKTSANDFKNTIVNLLTPGEVAKAMQRFAQVKSELKKKKANTTRIKFMQRKLDIMTGYAGVFGSEYANVEEGLETQIAFYRNQISKLYAEGALIDKSEWGEKTAQYLNSDNSYYGLVVGAYKAAKARGKTIPSNA